MSFDCAAIQHGRQFKDHAFSFDDEDQRAENLTVLKMEEFYMSHLGELANQFPFSHSDELTDLAVDATIFAPNKPSVFSITIREVEW